MRQIEINYRELSYPIGNRMSTANAYMIDAYTAFSAIEEYKNKHVTIVCRGSSGSILATLFASKFPDIDVVDIQHIKKDGELSHHSGISINNESIVVLIDDFVSSGGTVDAIQGRVMADGKQINVVILMNGWGRRNFSWAPSYLIRGSL